MLAYFIPRPNLSAEPESGAPPVAPDAADAEQPQEQLPREGVAVSTEFLLQTLTMTIAL